MSKVLPDYFPRNISQYVPNMEFAADVIDGVVLVSLGAPSIENQDGILDGVTIGDGAAHTFTSSDFAVTFDGSSTHIGEDSAGVINAKYGRCLIALGDASTDETVTVSGRDYLGQKMSEVFTLAGVVLQFGKKAFKYIDSVLVSSSSGGSLMDLGWSDRLGLPYKAEKMISYTENDVSFPVDPVEVVVEVDAVRYASGADVVLPSPITGYITGVHSVVTTATTGIQTSTVVVGTTDVLGISLVIAATSGVATLDSDVATTDDDQVTSKVAKFGAMGISGNGTPTAGAATYTVTVEPITFIAGVDTDPQTTSTTDPRGTIRCTTPCDASIVYEVSYTCDTSDLHGVEAV
jgi:hypothetical protein